MAFSSHDPAMNKIDKKLRQFVDVENMEINNFRTDFGEFGQ